MLREGFCETRATCVAKANGDYPLSFIFYPLFFITRSASIILSHSLREYYHAQTFQQNCTKEYWSSRIVL